MRVETIKQLACALGVKVSFDGKIKGFSLDSREVKEGDIFCAVRGENVDGHAFLNEAFEKGAIAALVDRSYFGTEPRVIQVPLVVKALQRLAALKMSETSIPVIAVTGSVGKTTLKEFISTLLSGLYSVFKTPGNLNSQLGLPLAILNGLNSTHEVAVIEMGMSRPGEILNLVNIATPTVAVINSVGYCHAENFKDLSGIALAKAEIFSRAETHFKLYHAEIASYLPENILQGAIPFALDNPALPFSLLCERDSIFFVESGNKLLLPDCPFQEPHLLHALLAALAACRLIGAEVERLADRIRLLTLPEKRFQRVEKRGVILINDAYNACPLSMKASLQALSRVQTGGKRIGVLGSMAELGSFSQQCHEEVGACALTHLDKLFCYGREAKEFANVWQRAGREAHHFEDISALKKAVIAEASPGDLLLLKGSNSNQLWKIVEEFDT